MFSTWKLCAVVVVLGTWLVPGAAGAWPLYQKDFQARLTLEQEYTDNLQLMTVRGDEDFVSTIEPGLTLSAVSEQSGIKLDYDFGYSQYWRLDDGFTRHNGRGEVWQEWEHWRFDATGAFSRQEYPIELSAETGDIIGLRDTVSPYYRASTTPGLAYQFGEERLIRAGFNYMSYWNNDPRFQDSEMNSPNINITYALNKFNVLQAGYTYEMGNYGFGTFSDTSDLEAHRANAAFIHRFNPRLDVTVSYAFSDLQFDTGTGYRTHQGTLGTNWAVSEATALSLSAGYYQINLNGQTKSGPVINGSLSRAFPRGRLTLSGEYGFGEDYYSAENLGVYEYWGGRGKLSYKLTEYLEADASGGYRNNDYALEGRSDEYWNAGTGLSWLVRPWLTARAAYRHTDYLTTSGATFFGERWDFDVNTYSVSLTATYD